MKKKLLMMMTVLLALGGLTACGAKGNDEASSNIITLKNKMIVTVNDVSLKDKYGDLKAGATSAALVVNLTVENPKEKEDSFGSSSVELEFNGEKVNAEMLAGAKDGFGLFETVRAGETITKSIVFGVPAVVSESDKLTLNFVNVLAEQQGSYNIDTSNLEKEDSTPKVSADVSGDMQVAEYEGVIFKAGPAVIMNNDEAQAAYPELSKLERGYVFAIVDVEITNNTTESLKDLPGKAPSFNLIDNFGENNFQSAVYARSLGDGVYDSESEIAPGETRAGKMLFFIKDDVTGLEIETTKIHEDRTKLKVKVM